MQRHGACTCELWIGPQTKGTQVIEGSLQSPLRRQRGLEPCRADAEVLDALPGLAPAGRQLVGQLGAIYSERLQEGSQSIPRAAESSCSRQVRPASLCQCKLLTRTSRTLQADICQVDANQLILTGDTGPAAGISQALVIPAVEVVCKSYVGKIAKRLAEGQQGCATGLIAGR